MKKISYVVYAIYFLVLMSRIDTETEFDKYVTVLIVSFISLVAAFVVAYFEENEFNSKNKFLNWLFKN